MRYILVRRIFLSSSRLQNTWFCEVLEAGLDDGKLPICVYSTPRSNAANDHLILVRHFLPIRNCFLSADYGFHLDDILWRNSLITNFSYFAWYCSNKINKLYTRATPRSLSQLYWSQYLIGYFSIFWWFWIKRLLSNMWLYL